MFAKIRRLLGQLFSKSRTVNNEPLNKVSLIVIILIDIFILVNVFTGLNDISGWHLSPNQAYPCHSEWDNYRTKTTNDKDYQMINLALPNYSNNQLNRQIYQQAEEGHLGKVSPICLQYAEYKDKIKNPPNLQTIKTIEQQQNKVSNLEQSNKNIRAQYDSTLLDKIAGQPSDKSINQVSAEKAKQTLDQNKIQISTITKEISQLKNELLTKPESTNFLAFLKNENTFGEVETGYKKASFWYPSIQLGFQALFLLPLIFIALLVHNISQRQGYGLIALISWHLLVIFLIPLILKIFEFLQVGAIFKFIFDIVGTLLGGLLFLVSYVYILIVPLVGFGIIKFFQRIVFNAKVQAVSRVQKSRCINCAKKIRHNDIYCPHCGYDQFVECENCHELTYKALPYCKHCGTVQGSSGLHKR
ncbi:zinc ribbon domain-containing protein [Anabaena cylindrica FACHB-243]|uniref:DZANK-type domain-containing protein n=1 Tax=Anabaena cylindrica (strain ATCC 27899 / PCC 7122) TaxID=272123 RepID=K9ZJ58_ANACC|nr:MULTISPECIES: zinc ribbon domain-containing protein [Anabaena]AFZ58597.1 hypothetical protein Anacy_3187 [Anabaena cylindrica PCC 7122]MBD2416359.1 zinc ribbon domain-containing protein [Anabaena cylindrica FACHB-243]MBY5284471.1 zinc ribbon domain-containing protein [Anabaena sp. CCAP 1446/1C]MBY5311715.1 zinc ribbon domain-containing protein [Anabaena sp. CCAP 1446/1C]MCM2407261.1 zinc ribbon domain-containing protein [Anabaena sp. CCAP 1446/1C]